MNSLFDQSDVSNVLARVDTLTPGHRRNWGKMNATQMLSHCNAAMETAMGRSHIKRVFIGRIIGTLLKSRVLGEKPFGKNSPTDRTYIYSNRDDLDFGEEKIKLKQSIHQFYEGGPSKCTTHPHPFFGNFTPEQWAVFQWKHLDHHLRQFGV